MEQAEEASLLKYPCTSFKAIEAQAGSQLAGRKYFLL